MTFPVVQTTNTGVNESANATSHTVNLPASIAAGDLLLIIAEFLSNPGTVSVTGWTFIQTDANGTAIFVSYLWKLATGSEGATATLTTSNSVHGNYISYRISGWDGVTAPATGTATTGSSSNPDPPSLTPSWGAQDTLWIPVEGHANTAAITTAPTNYTNLITISVNSSSVSSAQRQLNAATENPGTFTSSGTPNTWVAQTIAIKPPASANYPLTEFGYNDFYQHPPPPKPPEVFVATNMLPGLLTQPGLKFPFVPYDFYRHPPPPEKIWRSPEFIFPNLTLAFNPPIEELLPFNSSYMFDWHPPRSWRLQDWYWQNYTVILQSFVLVGPYDQNYYIVDYKHPPEKWRSPEFIWPNIIIRAPPLPPLQLTLRPYDFYERYVPPPHPIEPIFPNGYLLKMIPGPVPTPVGPFIRNAEAVLDKVRQGSPALTKVRQTSYTLEQIRVGKARLDK